MPEDTNAIMARPASPSLKVLDERPSSSMITDIGMTMVHNTFLITAASNDREDKRMLVSTTSMV